MPHPNYPDLIIADSPVAFWRLGESGLVSSDLVSPAADATFHTSGVTKGSTRLLALDAADTDGSVLLDGAAGRLAAGDPAKLQLVDEVWIDCLYRPVSYPIDDGTASQLYHAIVSKGFNGASVAYLLRIDVVAGEANQKMVMGSFHGGVYTPGAEWNFTAADWPLGETRRISAGYTAGHWVIRINGVQVAELEDATGPDINATGVFCIGCEDLNGTKARFANAYIDEVAVYDTALTMAQEQSHQVTSVSTDNVLNLLDEQFGFLVCFGIPTFTGLEIAEASDSIDLFDPGAASCDMDALVDQAVIAGANYAILTTKHHDGFALWPSVTQVDNISATTWYAANGSRDLVDEFVTACLLQGVKPGLYLSVWDKRWEAANPGYTPTQYTDFVKDQISELAAYSPEILWLDGWKWHFGNYTTVDYDDVVAHARAVLPSTAVFAENSHEDTLEHTEISIREIFVSDPEPAQYEMVPTEVVQTIRGDNKWFWSADAQTPRSAAQIAASIALYNPRYGNYLLGIPLDDTGAIPADTIAILAEVQSPMRFSYPTNGEILLTGTAYTVLWDTDDPYIADVDLLYSTDGGDTYPITIVSSTPNDGSYSWTPEYSHLSPTSVLRVRDSSDVSVHGSSVPFKVATTDQVSGSSNSDQENNIMYIPENTTQPLFRVMLPGSPIDVAFDDADLAISYRIETQTSFTTLTLAAGTLGTWITETLIKEADGSDIYQLCLPAAAIVSGKKTFLRLTYAGSTTNATISATQGSGGGDGDATLENQELILDQLQAALTAASAVIPEAAGIIEGFPDSLTIGDSYVTALNNFIKVYVRDSVATPLTGIGSKNFIDADFAADLTVSQGSKASLVTATCTWVPAVGLVEGYLKVEFPSDQTRRATEGSATMQLIFRWDGGIESTIATQPVEWEQRVTRTLQ